MKLIQNELQLAATDLANHLACRHLTSLDLRHARGEIDEPDWTNPFTGVLRELGLEHETAYLDHLKDNGLRLVELEARADDPASALDQTVRAMRDGPDAIYQPTLRLGDWIGRADVALRVDAPSEIGPWSYEVVDCKLARSTRAGTILQLALYSEGVQQIQGVLPERMYVLAPGTGFRPTPFRTAEYLAYYRSVARRFLRTVSDDASLTYPEPTSHCEICRWWRSCDARRRSDDHPSFVAGISRLQIEQLREWDVTTLERLSKMSVPLSQRPRRGSPQGYIRVREQARVQAEARESQLAIHEMLPFEPGLGLARLPEPSPGDVFLDLEGDRFAGESGLEYLFGLATAADGGSVDYKGRWAFDAGEEKSVFEWTIDEIDRSLERFPEAHVYHFGHYETTALKRLMGRYATREREVDDLLRGGKFVDLHSIVRHAVRAGVEAYSLKELERFHGFKRETPLQEASASKRAIERSIELSVVERIEESAKQAVESYNRDDCLSALSLRTWLEQLRDESIRGGASVQRPTVPTPPPSEDQEEREREIHRLVSLLTHDVPIEAAERSTEQHARWLLAHLLEYHRREGKADWWEFFRLRDLDAEASVDEKNAIAGLTFEAKVGGTRSCPIHRYRFPRQEIGFRAGENLKVRDDASDHWTKTTTVGSVDEIDPSVGTIHIKKTSAARDVHAASVFVDPVFGGRSDPRRTALLALAQWVADHGIDSMGPFRAARSLLLRRPPRLAGGLSLEAVQASTDSTLDAATTLSLSLTASVLPIQGPPGSGKTFTGARVICELVRAGRKVGVTALGHKAIANLLKNTADAAREEGLNLTCIRKVGDADPDLPDNIVQTSDNNEPIAALSSGAAQVAAGTAWLWARPEYESSIDVLVVDEAGQMPLADVLAVSRAADSLVLLGDPAQLDQPQQGSHPDGVAVSALQHILGEEGQTMTEDRGLFLSETWRLHPQICKFTSEVFYENKLTSRPGLDRQALFGESPFVGAGLWFAPVGHAGNQNSSEEEVETVARIVESLLESRTQWADSDGSLHTLELQDVLVVAPYNAQVLDLLARLPTGARVGTVDKFQGQQAPIVIYSMTTSSPEDAPHGMEFLYSLNRLNVATSRARCASILVATERLLEAECRTPRQMKLANALCRYVELAQTVHIGDMGRGRASGAAAGSGI